MERFSAKLTQMDDILGAGRNFDMVSRDLTIAGSRARLYVVNGYAKEDILERIIAAGRRCFISPPRRRTS